ncbi:MAG: cytochrome C [Pirellulales bacterium]
MPHSRSAFLRSLFVVYATVAVSIASTSAARAEFPHIYDSEKEVGEGAQPPEVVARDLQLPPGFKANVFAAEPDVQNPIALAWDAKGRLWVAENYTYAEAGVKFDTKLRDRILILSDTDGDGRMDERKVFAEDLSMLTSIEVGLGGVWCLTLPELTFIPDKDGDDKPDGPPQTHLVGFRVPPENYHNFANGLRFGPDGWLYGRCGASAPADVGRPGTPTEEFIPVRGGMWRYSPFTKVFESLNSGTTNPWGHDWDRHGELFFINTVNGHLWHSIPGAHYTRPHTIDPNPHVYELIDFHADHWHYDTRGDWSKSRDGAANEFGGGHAHIGCMIYQGMQWPEQYRDRLFTLNMHGLRANTERLDRHGSGYVAKHEKDLFITADKWFRGMELTEGPDGAVYVADWSDTGECHERTGVHRTSGRIYKISYTEPGTKPAKPLPITAFQVGMPGFKQTPAHSGFTWTNRMFRRALIDGAQELRTRPVDERVLVDAFKSTLDSADSVSGLLDLMWLLSGMNQLDAIPVAKLTQHKDEHVRTWAVRLLVDRLPLDTTMSERPVGDDPGLPPESLALLHKLAGSDPSAHVRLSIASALQRLRPDQRIGVVRELVAHSEDAGDHNLPLMIWYGLIPTAENHAPELAKLAADCKLPTTRRLIARRLAEDVEKRPTPFNDLLAASIEKQDPALAADVVRGASAALTGWRKAPKPAAWDKFATLLAMTDDKTLASQVRELSVLFGDGRALDVVKALALNNDAPIAERRAALQTLIDARPDYLRDVCQKTLGVRFLNPTAARGLALFDDEKAAKLLVESYKKFHHSTRAELLAVLASRPTFAKAFLTAIVEEKIPRTDLTAFLARQIHDYKNADLEKLLKQTWGEFRDSPAEKKAEIAKLKTMLTPSLLASADKSAGRALFAKTCRNATNSTAKANKSAPT